MLRELHVLVEDRIAGTNISIHLTETADCFRLIFIVLDQSVRSVDIPFCGSAGDEIVGAGRKRKNIILFF